MQPLFLPMQAIAAERGEGLRLDLIRLAALTTADRTFSAQDVERAAAYRSVPQSGASASCEGLDVEIFGPHALLPHGQRCSMHFDASGTPTITIGTRSYGHGYVSPYFAGLVVARLGIPPTRVRLYYAGDLPAAKITFRDLRGMPDRESVGPENARIGDLIELLCEQAIEKGCRYFARAWIHQHAAKFGLRQV